MKIDTKPRDPWATTGDNTWYDLLRSARRKLGVPREALAQACDVSADTIRSYELGRRGPKRETLEAILGSLNLKRHEANAILHSAGFAVDRLSLGIQRERLIEHGERVPWPQVILTEELQVLSANSVVRQLSVVNQNRREQIGDEQAFLAMAETRVYESLANWEEVLAFHISHWKKAVGPELPTGLSWMPSLTQKLSRLDKPKLGRFFDLWESTPPMPAGVRSECLHVWRHPQFGLLRFLLLNGSVEDCPDVLVHDWCPADADTWRALEIVRAR